ncbi:MAG TPA: LCP family protein [Selenomonadales bacterium]|nr:LCP family protein [Selenomonadales bacterium]
MATRLEKRLAEQRGVRRKRWGLIFGSIFIFLFAVATSYLWFDGRLDNKARHTGGLFFSSHKVNILVLGVDERSGDVGRSDTMFAVTVDTDSKEVSLLSIPRDTRVKIPGHGWDKINHAYAEGKQQLSQRAAEDLLGISFDYTVVINFAGFSKIVDAIGGVDIDVEKRMYYEDPYDNLVIDIEPGMQHLDGKSAIKYVRYRDSEGDIGRIERQQKFMKAMLQQVASPGVIVRVPAIIREVSATIQSNMSTAEMLNLAKLLNDAQKQGLKTDMVPGRGAYIQDISYWLPDIVGLRRHIAQTQGGALDSRQLAEARRLADEYERSIPKEMKVAEVPKAVQPDTEDADADDAATKPADKAADKKGAAKPAKPPAPGKTAIAVINASGNPAAGTKMVNTLKAQGFEVTSVSSSSTVANDTVVISYTTSSAVVHKLTGLPFKYVLQITRDDTRSTSAAVLVGKDYK